MDRKVLLLRHGTDSHVARRIKLRIVFHDVVEHRSFWLLNFPLDLEHRPYLLCFTSHFLLHHA